LNIEVLIELLGSLGFYFLNFLSLVMKRGDQDFGFCDGADEVGEFC